MLKWVGVRWVIGTELGEMAVAVLAQLERQINDENDDDDDDDDEIQVNNNNANPSDANWIKSARLA